MNRREDTASEELPRELPRFFFREWREATGLSLGALSRIMGRGKNTILRVEKGQRGFSIDYLLDFARAVGAPSCGAVLDRPPDHSYTGSAAVRQIEQRTSEIRARLREISERKKNSEQA